MAYRIPPGPAGTSCLTCKRRHKKCDRGKPVCARCSKGGYECLGYEHNKPTYTPTNDEPQPDQAETTVLRTFPSGSSTSSSSRRSTDSPQADESFVLNEIEATRAIYDTDSGVECLVSPNVAWEPPGVSESSTSYGADTSIYDTSPTTRSGTQVLGAELSQSLFSVDTAITTQPPFPSDPILSALASQIPQAVPLPPEVGNILEYVISRIDRFLSITYFKPQGRQIAKFRADAAWRLSTSEFARQGMLIYAKIRSSIIEGNESGNEGNFLRWIDGHEQALSSNLNQSLTPYEHQERYHDILETFYVKVDLYNAAATYQLMCELAPKFLQTVYSDPALWSTDNNPALISIAHVLSCPRYGPTGYMLMDIMASMIYGVPHLVEYNTRIEIFHAEVHSAEWMNCVPGECLRLLAKINISRDQGLLADDWRDIEQRIVSWEPRLRFKPEGLDSNKSVAWLALHEAWRQTLLIYLYLALCGAPTDDPRIQSSLRQLFKIIGAVKRHDSPIANIHFFPQYLMAGICSRTEKQRQMVRERLGNAAETRLWVFHGPDIIPVLDHLWLGAAIGGQPITWNDYIHSRHVMLPLSS